MKTSTIDTSTVKELDLNRYMGIWYEIARYPHSFEKNLEGVTATYAIKENGMISVLNQGYKGGLEGKHKIAKGKAKRPDENEPGKLKVSFFLWFYGDYYVLDLDKDYQWALIGSSSDNYLWILSRTPVISDELFFDLTERLLMRGYDLRKLQKVKQKAVF